MSKAIVKNVTGVKNLLDILSPVDPNALQLHQMGGRARRAELDAIAEEARRIGHDEGFEIGYAKGHEQGFEVAREESSAHLMAERQQTLHEFRQHLAEIASEIAEQCNQLLADVEVRASLIAVEIAKKIVDQEIETRPGIVVDWTRSALHELRLSNQVLVRVAESDAEALDQAWDELQAAFKSIGEIRKVVDSDLQRGVIVESDLGTVDATVETFINKLSEADEEAA